MINNRKDQRMSHSKSLLCLLCVLASSWAAAQSAEYVVSNIYIDNVRQPKSILDVAKECSNNRACMALASAAEAYFQVPVSKVVSGAAALAPTQQGEGTYVNATLPPGYAYCKTAMRMVSIVPKDGPRGSLFLGRADANGLYYETWTPVQGAGQGRSWVEATISLLGIRQDLASAAYQDGRCFKPVRVLWYCRGGGCTDSDDKGQSKDANPPPPGANSQK
jgi:hypothetical protein